MGKYNGAVITAAGQNLIAQAIAESKTVTFTTTQASSHVYPSSTDFEALTALMDVEKTVDINYAGVYSDTVVQVSARFDNDGVDTAYLINTLGFFAQLDSDTPILFAVSTAVTPDQMPVFDADNPSAFIYNMQITVQNADSINLSVNPAGTVTVEQLNTVVSIINAKIGDLSDLTTDNKTSLVNAMNEVDSHTDTNTSAIGTLSNLSTDAKTNLVAAINEVDGHADAAQASANNAQQMIAPVLTTLVAPTGGLAIGDQFVYNGLLYKATAAIAEGGTITINGNCTLADSATKQIKNVINLPIYYGIGLSTVDNITGFSILADGLYMLTVRMPANLEANVVVRRNGVNYIQAIVKQPNNINLYTPAMTLLLYANDFLFVDQNVYESNLFYLKALIKGE